VKKITWVRPESLTRTFSAAAARSSSKFSRTSSVNDRQFGALTFQTMAGVNLKCGHWSATAGYEINDWLNQCQIFDDATGPHNNDLIVQGLSIKVSYAFCDADSCVLSPLLILDETVHRLATGTFLRPTNASRRCPGPKEHAFPPIARRDSPHQRLPILAIPA
jgi:hypothetical protein